MKRLRSKTTVPPVRRPPAQRGAEDVPVPSDDELYALKASKGRSLMQSDSSFQSLGPIAEESPAKDEEHVQALKRVAFLVERTEYIEARKYKKRDKGREIREKQMSDAQRAQVPGAKTKDWTKWMEHDAIEFLDHNGAGKAGHFGDTECPDNAVFACGKGHG